jgi:hypothetical protein
VLQYWYFYAFNDWCSTYFGVNDHEADWETIAAYLVRDDAADAGTLPHPRGPQSTLRMVFVRLFPSCRDAQAPLSLLPDPAVQHRDDGLLAQVDRLRVIAERGRAGAIVRAVQRW